MAGCVPHDHGWAASYKEAQDPKIAVVMPAEAPSIAQEFFESSVTAGHLGIDVIDKVGTPVIAVAAGQVDASFYEPAYGNRVVIDHGPVTGGVSTYTVYKHLEKRLVQPGEQVERGQQIATLGVTGALGGGIPHLHFEVWRGTGKRRHPVDPQRSWANGPGRVTCFDPAAPAETTGFRLTYPVGCR
ncbi:M23 family metallopeptidase [Hoeflea marina]|uniref:M23 family metallopeptidase n=1 Tax=Hoeflea marina TaxID=274592 RepID=UPI001304F9DD|nr:M23 family metallopeptidase [Hoeflea marina]